MLSVIARWRNDMSELIETPGGSEFIRESGVSDVDVLQTGRLRE